MPIFLKPPAADQVERVLQQNHSSPFAYPHPGITWESNAGTSPPALNKFNWDRYGIRLGQGGECFRKAKSHFENWEMFSLDWIRLYPIQPLIQEGQVVGVLVKVAGVWILNLCRIVRTLAEARQISFSYGTLSNHAEAGEEKFSLEWSAEDDTVRYEINAVSRPNMLIAKLAYPYVRNLQKRFCRESMEHMRELIRS